MKYCNCLLIAVFAMCISFSMAQKANTSTWNKQAKTIDGNLNDWPQPIKFAANTPGMQFAFSNDSSSLYIALNVADGMIQMKMLHEGLRLFIDAEGHRSENKMLEFPLPLPADKRAEGGRDKPDTFALKIRLVQNLNALLASGLIGIPNGNLPVDNPYDIKAAATWDSLNQMTIEYQIPLKYLSISNLKPLISIGLYLPGSNAMNDDFMPPPRGPGAPGPGPGGDGMGMGGPPPGGGDMDGPPTGMGQFRDANREFKTWMKIKLAEGP